MLSKDRRFFFLRWLNNPLRVGAPVPSSKGLAIAMAAQLCVDPNEYVVELGPGTGAVTHALLRAGIAPSRLVIVERDPHFYQQLKRDFPQSVVLQGDARNLTSILHQHKIYRVAAVVSSLPLLSMPDAVRHAIVQASFSMIKPDGAFIQYTYGLLSPVPQHHQRTIGIHGKIMQRVWRNFPPARVWRYTAA